MVKSNELDHCAKDALTGFLGLILQGVLAGLAFTCLIAKRFREPPGVRRSWETWWYDTSKQGIGAILIHLANVAIAPLFQGDPCTWYVINFLLDSTIGLLILFIGIRSCQFLSHHKKWPAINFGVYDAPKSWIYQTGIYIGLMALVKISTTLFVQLKFWSSVKDLVLAPFSNAAIELTLFMLVIPFFVNLLIFWVTDNFLMRHDDHQHQKRSFLINYVGNYRKRKSKEKGNGLVPMSPNGMSGGGGGGANGKLATTNLFQRAKSAQYTNIFPSDKYIRSDSFSSIKLIGDDDESESDALISGDERFGIDDGESYDDCVALEPRDHRTTSLNIQS